MADREYLVPVNISAEEYLRLYQGTARSVLARDAGGLSISFPATALRPYVTKNGIQGVFVIRVDANHKLIDIRRKTP